LALDLKKSFYMVLGFFDYMQEKAEDLRREFIQRGEGKSENLREFFDDVLENFPFMLKRPEDDAEADSGADADSDNGAEDDGSPLKLPGLSDAIEPVKDLLDNIGLANRDDLADLNEKLDRLQETVKNLIRK
jgi:polyhydroxyalkanoate synthesis regulator phasin